MENQLVQYLDRITDLAESGYEDEAIRLANKLLEIFFDDKAIILFEKAKLEFQNGYDKEALFDFIAAYEQSGDQEIYELILEAYYVPNKDTFQQTFQKNIKCLKQYPHYRNDYEIEELEFAPIWQDEEILVCVDTSTGQFGTCERKREENLPEKNQTALMLNSLWMDDILLCEEKSGIQEHFMDMDVPMYLVFDKVFWMLFAQLYDLEPLLKKNRIVFLIGTQSVRNYFQEDMVLFPNWLTSDATHSEYALILSQISKRLEQEEEKHLADIAYYYEENTDKILARISDQKPRILFLTSRFTTVLQYHTRDCMQAAAKLGCETKLLMEPDGIHRVYNSYKTKVIAEFKPDIIFNIDHFRFEYQYIPQQVVWVTWAQDLLPDIMSEETPQKLTNRDFVMNHFTTWKKFRTIGYADKYLIEAPIPANSRVYKTYQLSKEEREEYFCDICFVCHAADVDAHIQEVLQRFPKDLWEALCAIYKGYQSYVYETGNIFYTEDVFAQYIEGALKQNYNLAFRPEVVKYLAEDMSAWFNQRVFRQVLVDWILDAGFTNIKLWGNGWTTDAKYKEYAMGPAENGEVLSKIYQSAKIVIGNNIMTTAAARAWETMLSGGFYISNYIPEEEDVTDIRKIVEVDKDVVMFYDREDLIQKLHYYLEHEEERQEMIKRGRKAALENMTFDILMKRVLKEVSERLEENGYE